MRPIYNSTAWYFFYMFIQYGSWASSRLAAELSEIIWKPRSNSCWANVRKQTVSMFEYLALFDDWLYCHLFWGPSCKGEMNYSTRAATTTATTFLHSRINKLIKNRVLALSGTQKQTLKHPERVSHGISHIPHSLILCASALRQQLALAAHPDRPTN